MYKVFEDLAKKHGLSNYAISKKTGVAQSVLSTWKNEKHEPSLETMQMLAGYFNVSVDYLLTGKENTPSEAKGVRVPVLGNVAAGIPIEAIEDIVDWEDIPVDWMYGGYEYFGLKVKGDSMYPKYLNEDTVIVRKQEACENGQDCVVYINGYDATLKTVKISDEGDFTILPINPNYPPTTYTAQEVEEMPISICGIVVELRRSIL